jgi:hypothetical protein
MMSSGACLYMICALLAVLGRVFAQFLGARRELDNKNRQLRFDSAALRLLQ